MTIDNTIKLENIIRREITNFKNKNADHYDTLHLLNNASKKYNYLTDIDILIVLKDTGNPEIALLNLKRWLFSIRNSLDFYVVSDLFFIPFIKTISINTPILHLIIFPSTSHYKRTLFYCLDSNIKSKTNIITNYEMASEIVALSDALRLWCITNLNNLNKSNSII